MKKIYERPLAEVIELKTEDIITTSLAQHAGDMVTKIAGHSVDSYDKTYNLTAGGITLQ